MFCHYHSKKTAGKNSVCKMVSILKNTTYCTSFINIFKTVSLVETNVYVFKQFKCITPHLAVILLHSLTSRLHTLYKTLVSQFKFIYSIIHENITVITVTVSPTKGSIQGNTIRLLLVNIPGLCKVRPHLHHLP